MTKSPQHRRRCSSAHLLSLLALGIIAVCLRFYNVDLSAVAPSEFDARGLQATKLQTNFRRDEGEILDLPDYNRQMAKEAVRPTILTCSSFEEEDGESEDSKDKDADDFPSVATTTREGFAFVHVYKASGSTLRDLFSSFSHICGDASWAVINCKSSNRCKPKYAVADREMFIPDPSTFNKTIAGYFDIIGGHFRIGYFNHPDRTRRHITFLRDAKARFVSGILYQLMMRDEPEMSLEDVARMIKRRVIGSRKANEYWSKSLDYLLTPEQSASLGTMAKGEDTAKATALMAVNNLVAYNTIVGVTENMDHSISILRHVLCGPGLEASDDTKKRLDEMFERYKQPESLRNRSDNGDLSTTSVLELLKNDTEFMKVFDEYLKYENLITGYASRMHEMQYREVNHSDYSSFDHPAVPVPSTSASAIADMRPSTNTTRSNFRHHVYTPPCLRPSPVPMILMGLGRSGTASAFEVMSKLSGNGQTKMIELTGSSTRKSEMFFDEMNDDSNGEWMVEFLCEQQRQYPDAGVVGFKWKPFETVFGEKSRRSLDLLSRLDDPQIKVVRSRRNLLDVLISRHKHKYSKMGKGALHAHCRKSDVECLQKHLEAGSRLELPTVRLVGKLRELHDMEARTDNLLRELNVPAVHVSFERLFGAVDPTDEWGRVFSHLGIAVHNLTAKRIEQAAHAATSLPHHNDTLANYNDVRQTLFGTEFELLLH